MYFVEGNGLKGAIIPTSNFEPLPVAMAAQRLGIAMTHLSHNSVQRTIHLSDDHFTGLTRFLSDPENKGHAFVPSRSRSLPCMPTASLRATRFPLLVLR